MQCSCRFLFSRPPSDSKDCLASLNPHQGFLLITCCGSMASKLWNSMQKFYSCMDAVCCYQLRRGGCCIIAWGGSDCIHPISNVSAGYYQQQRCSRSRSTRGPVFYAETKVASLATSPSLKSLLQESSPHCRSLRASIRQQQKLGQLQIIAT